MRHKVGDKVKIKSRKEIDSARIDTNDFGDTGWEECMYDYCGKEHVIEDICNSTEYILKGIHWFWTDDMFEDRYIWGKEEQHVGSITVDMHFDMQAFKHDVLEYITNMDLTKYININQGT